MVPIGSTYRTGQKNPVSGVFQCLQCNGSAAQNTIPLSSGETFPPCRRCTTAVTWKLIRYA
jgi:hypothetical protein